MSRVCPSHTFNYKIPQRSHAAMFDPTNKKHRKAMKMARGLVYGGGMDRAQTSVVNPIVAITIGAIVIAFVGVVGVDQLADTSLSANASDGATSIYNILDLIVVLAFLLLLIGMALRGRT